MKNILLLLLVGISIFAGAQSRKIDTQDSRFTIHVDKSGFFSALGHKHVVEARFASGKIDESAKTIEFTVAAGSLNVADPDTKPDERAEVQKNMQEKVLESANYPDIRFHSTEVKLTRPGHWTVTGDLTLHGVTKSVTVEVSEPTAELLPAGPSQSRHYNGSATIKQTDFGITPIKIGGGAVRVKDELKIEFEVVSR
jgi:polyisoprenoid-binding protein YceI